MSYHLFKTSSTRTLLTTASQKKNLTFPNFSNPVQSSAHVGDVSLPPSEMSARSDCALHRRQQLTNRQHSDCCQDHPRPCRSRVGSCTKGLRYRGPSPAIHPWQRQGIKLTPRRHNRPPVALLRQTVKHLQRRIAHYHRRPSLEPMTIPGTRSNLKNRELRRAFCPWLTNEVTHAKSRKLSPGKRLPCLGHSGSSLSSNRLFCYYSIFFNSS